MISFPYFEGLPNSVNFTNNEQHASICINLNNDVGAIFRRFAQYLRMQAVFDELKCSRGLWIIIKS